MPFQSIYIPQFSLRIGIPCKLQTLDLVTKMRLSHWLTLSLATLATSSPLSTHVTHEKRQAVPIAWTKHTRAPKDAILPARIGLNQRNLEHSDRFLHDISDPDSPNFGENPVWIRKLRTLSLVQANTGPQSTSPTRSHRIQRRRIRFFLGWRARALISSA